MFLGPARRRRDDAGVAVALERKYVAFVAGDEVIRCTRLGHCQSIIVIGITGALDDG